MKPTRAADTRRISYDTHKLWSQHLRVVEGESLADSRSLYCQGTHVPGAWACWAVCSALAAADPEMPTRQDALQVLCVALAPKQTEIKTWQAFCIKLLLDSPAVVTSNTLNMPAEPPKCCVLFKTTLTENQNFGFNFLPDYRASGAPVSELFPASTKWESHLLCSVWSPMHCFKK